MCSFLCVYCVCVVLVSMVALCVAGCGQAWYMKRSLDNGDIHEALKHAAAMCEELRTSKLSPKVYGFPTVTACGPQRPCCPVRRFNRRWSLR